jgi:putative membrane protein
VSGKGDPFKEAEVQVLLIFSLIVAIIAVGFAVQNSETATIQFLFWTWEIPLAFALLLSMLLGALISILASLPAMTRSKLALRRQRKQQSELDSGLKSQQEKLAEAETKLAEMDALQTRITEQNVKLAEAQQKIQVLEGRLALLSAKNPAEQPPAQPPQAPGK